MSQDTIIAIVSLLGGAIGTAQINGARVDDERARALREEASWSRPRKERRLGR